MKLSDCLHGSIVRLGSGTYRLYRLEQFASGLLGTMKRFARLQPCVDRGPAGWWDDHKQQFIIRDWNLPCELVDATHTAVAGECFDTRSKGNNAA